MGNRRVVTTGTACTNLVSVHEDTGAVTRENASSQVHLCDTRHPVAPDSKGSSSSALNQDVSAPCSPLTSDDEGASDFEGFDSGDADDEEVSGGESEPDDSDVDVADNPTFDQEEQDELFGGDADFAEPDWTKTDLEDITVPHFQSDDAAQFPIEFSHGTATPFEYLELYLTKDFYKLLLTNTNKYAVWKQKEMGKPNYAWKELKISELKAFLAIKIAMGISPSPQYACYWSSSDFMCNVGIKKLLSKRKYELISQYLHVSDRENEIEHGQPGYDRAAKVRPLMDQLGDTFTRLKPPSEYQTIHEGMAKYKGRSA